jgi:NitT/TauT family transport system permease protein
VSTYSSSSVDSGNGPGLTPGPEPAGPDKGRSSLTWQAVGSVAARIAWPVGAAIILLVIWQVWVELAKTPEFLVPTPTEVAAATGNLAGTLWSQTLVTAGEYVVSLAVSVIIGVPIGLLIVESRIFSRAVYPLIIASQTFPKVAIAPLFIIWFGLGFTSKVAIAFSVAFFPIIVNTAVGIATVDPDLVVLARAIGLSPFKTFMTIKLPAALPTMFGGFKIASSLALVGAVVGEFLASNTGLGHMVVDAQGNGDTTSLFAALVALLVLGLVVYGLISLLEWLTVPWRRKSSAMAQSGAARFT